MDCWTIRIWWGDGDVFETRGWTKEIDARIDAVGFVVRGAQKIEILPPRSAADIVHSDGA